MHKVGSVRHGICRDGRVVDRVGLFNDAGSQIHYGMGLCHPISMRSLVTYYSRGCNGKWRGTSLAAVMVVGPLN